MSKENVMEILDKLEFFGGQRAGRELWAGKPKEIQDKDIEDFCRDLQIVRSALKEAEPVRYGRWMKRKEIFSESEGEVDAVGCSKCGKSQKAYRRTPYCPNCGAKMDEGVQ